MPHAAGQHVPPAVLCDDADLPVVLAASCNRSTPGNTPIGFGAVGTRRPAFALQAPGIESDESCW